MELESGDLSGDVLSDPLSVTLPDPDHSGSEDRLLVLGQSRFGRFLILSITERIISARPMTSRERKNYEHEIGR